MTTPIWEIDRFVEGPVTVRNRFRMEQQKGFRPDDPFYSDVRFESRPPLGFRATITARSDSKDTAAQVALVSAHGEVLATVSITEC